MTKLFSLILVAALSFNANASEKVEKTGKTEKAEKTEKIRKPNQAYPERPTQYVILAFDGSKNIDFWEASIAWADTMKTDQGKKPLRFTYFINPTYYLEYAQKNNYKTPKLNKSLSCIGWSAPAGSTKERLRMTNLAFEKGHEIASHAMAHCDQTGTEKGDPMYGNPWDENAWGSEFDQFNKIFFNSADINNIKDPSPMLITQNDVVGFRAPKLAFTDGLWPTLKRFNFRYDTSRSDAPTYWPQRMSWGGWNFPLARIKIAGTSKTTLSMDYNWVVYHSGGESKPGLTAEQREFFRKQMYDSYMYYFKQNYFGGRAPIHIGHHFSQWNQGAYWSAMKDFAKDVCNRKEVLCVTYKEYADYLDALPADIYNNYRQGKFAKLPDDKTIKDIAAPILASVRLDIGNDSFETMVETGHNLVKNLGFTPQLLINFDPHPVKVISKADLIKKLGVGAKVYLRAVLNNRSGKPIDWQTYKITDPGTPKEKISDTPLEETLTQGETSAAHDE